MSKALWDKVSRLAAEAWKSLTDIHDIKLELGLVNAEAALTVIECAEGDDLEAHFTEMHTAWGNTNDQGANIKDAKFGILII
ncbi:hypothetical protein C0991_011132, partial [Blastosporella zonata]